MENSINKVFKEWLELRQNGCENKLIIEGQSTARYSVEINFRTSLEEVKEGFSKLSISYISASMKQHGYTTKLLLTNKPYRLFISTRNFDQGEWVLVLCWNSEGYFVIASGFYNKDRNTVSIQKSHKTNATSAADLTKELRNIMERLKKEPSRNSHSLKSIPMKRGPKQTKLSGLL